MTLTARIMRLETKSLPDWRPVNVRLVASDEEELQAADQLRAEGFDPDGDDVLIIRLTCLQRSEK